MLNACTNACGKCEEKQTGCRRRNSTAPLAVPGGMTAMFERALSEFPEYEVTALSTDPYILQFENFVTAEQAEAMVKACKAFDRSLAGDQLSPVRTSTQCWCDDKEGCMADGVVHDLTLRMLNVTMLPYENAEYFQVKKTQHRRAPRATTHGPRTDHAQTTRLRPRTHAHRPHCLTATRHSRCAWTARSWPHSP